MANKKIWLGTQAAVPVFGTVLTGCGHHSGGGVKIYRRRVK